MNPGSTVGRPALHLLPVFILVLASTLTAQERIGPESPGSPPPLEYWQVVTKILTDLDGGCWPVNRKGNVEFIFRDLDINGYLDACILCVGVDSYEEAELSLLTDNRRLYDPSLPDLSYALLVYSQRQGTMVRTGEIGFGTRAVLGSYGAKEIRRGFELPFAVSAVFRTEDGSVTEWVVFSGSEMSRITLRENVTNNLLIDDIDADGYIDVIVSDSAFEEGARFETYLRWYRWDGSAFSEHRTTNIVRNLGLFFDRIKTALSRDGLPGMNRESLGEKGYQTAIKSGLDDDAIFKRIFTPADPSDAGEGLPFPPDAATGRAVFPDILENPFDLGGDAPYRFPITVRFMSESGAGYLYRASVEMNRNPFGDRQFTLVSRY